MSEGKTNWKKVWSVLKKVLPILVSIGIFVYIFTRIPFSKMTDAIEQGNNLLFFAVCIVYFTCTFFLECGGLYFIYNWMGCRTSFKEMLPVRGATYLLSLINYNVGLGGIVYYIHRKKKVPLLDSLSTLLFMSGWDFYIVAALCGYGLFVYGAGMTQFAALRVACVVIIATMVPYFIFVFRPFYRLTGKDLTPPWLHKIRKWRILSFMEWATMKRHLQILAIRIPVHLFIVLGHYIALHIYGVKVPFSVAMAFIPVVILIGVLPISFHGWGVYQLGALALFKGYGSEASIMAYSVMMNFFFLIIQVVIGSLFLKKAYHDVMPPKEKKAPASET